MAWCLVGNAYPITRETDYQAKSEFSKYYGVAMDKGHDTHFVEVDSGLGYQAVDDTRKRRADDVTFHEIVLRDPAQVLPRFIVYFKGVLPPYDKL